MSDPIQWTIKLGRVGGVRVSLHVLLLVFAFGKLLNATVFDPNETTDALQTLSWLGLLLLALVLHELGHAAIAFREGFPQDEVRLWPLGSLNGPQPVPISRASDAFLVAIAGPLTNLALALITALGLTFADAQMVLNPFGHDGDGNGAPLLVTGKAVQAFTVLWWLGWFGYINWVLFLVNLIPALPMDGGRMLRALLAGPTFGTKKDGLIAPWTARTFAIILGLVGLYRLVFQGAEGGIALISIAVLIEWMFRYESRMLEEGGYYEEGLFGYDFSEGYTSFDSTAPIDRPARETALARWRRRRSDLRRTRREAQEAAEDQRMDEILAKIHTYGRETLTDEENRFLIRVSAKFKGRSRTHD
jgi:Zn-dependent protease